jgi:hypothetical protein
MSKATKFIVLNKNTTLVTTSPIGWFYSEGKSIKHLFNDIHNTLAIVIPDADCHLQIKLSGSAFKKETTLLKEYAKACLKFNIKNIFA